MVVKEEEEEEEEQEEGGEGGGAGGKGGGRGGGIRNKEVLGYANPDKTECHLYMNINF